MPAKDLTSILTNLTESKKEHDKRRYTEKLKEEVGRLETIVRNALAESNYDKIANIVHQLCHEYAYAVYQPHARNGGLIGLAAAAIALGPEVARYMSEIVPPVLACFSDQDARVRYYACESMYNIAKVAKGEVLLYFNDLFDALCKLASDTEMSVKNGAELLDRLVKDIVSESAATYASVYQPESAVAVSENSPDRSVDAPTAFSLPRFIPLLQERITVLNPFTRTFLVSWITLLDSIPDLELVAYLPSFLGGLLKFLSDPNLDVHTITKVALDRFLAEIKRIAAVKKGITESRKSRHDDPRKESDPSVTAVEELHNDQPGLAQTSEQQKDTSSGQETSLGNVEPLPPTADEAISSNVADINDGYEDDVVDNDDGFDGEWIPGQDVHIDYPHILGILITFLSESGEEAVQVIALTWIEAFLEICPEDILFFTPRLLAQLLPALSHNVDHVKQAAARVNQALMSYVMGLPEESGKGAGATGQAQITGPTTSAPNASQPSYAPVPISKTINHVNGGEARRESIPRPSRKPASPDPIDPPSKPPEVRTPDSISEEPTLASEKPTQNADLDYEAAVGALTDQFVHNHEATRVAALAWLIMLHRKSPRKILAIQEATFPALLKTLSDPSDAVVTRDLLLLSQISKSSDDSYFTSFLVNLLKLFCTDRRLLETRGNLIIRQLCLSLPPEKIYRTMADCLEQDVEEDVEFASIMVQNLNNNLITAPELADLRKRLRNLDGREGQTFFTVLFRAWCVNAVATFSLCLLAQAYEQAYELLKIFANELEMTVNMLIQVDKLVQLLESPVFTYLRMQLLEPERYPHLYKCMYGVLMLLPQSSGFAALKNRLNSVSAIGYLHIAPRGTTTAATSSSGSNFERQNRLKSRDTGDASIRWNELLEKFRTTQDRVRRHQQRQQLGPQHDHPDEKTGATDPEHSRSTRAIAGQDGSRPNSAASARKPPVQVAVQSSHVKGRSSLGNLGRFTSGVGKGKGKKEV